MNLIIECNKRSLAAWASLCALGLAMSVSAGVKSYKVPKDPNAAGGPASSAAAADDEGAVTYKVPAGWEELPPGEMRAASLRGKGAGDKVGDVSVIPLPRFAGSDLDNVNRWRGQVGLPPVKAEELGKLAQKAQIAGESVALYDMAGQGSGETAKNRILAAIQRRKGTIWFYKLTGEDALVGKEKPAFISFLKSVRYTNAPPSTAGLPPSHPPLGKDGEKGTNQPLALPPSHPPIGGAMAELPPDHPPIGAKAGEAGTLPAGHPPLAPGGTPAAPGGRKTAWKVPGDWQELAPGQMQTAKFLAPGDAGAKAEATLAMMPGDGGGPLANVNRWRRQIGLGPIEAADLPKQTTSLDVGGAKAMVMDATASDQKKRMVVVSVSRGETTWFYKLLGDEPAVAKQKEAFLKSVATAP
jgi:hypothetical protein